MKIRNWMGHLAGVCAVLLCCGVPARSQTSAPQHRVVFVITSPDPADWGGVLANIRNLRAGIKPETAQIELIAYSGGTAMLKKGSPVEKDILAAEADGAVVLACGNSMKHEQLTLADMVAGVAVTPSGVVELMRKQEQGWSYIKAGK
jgi:intracellular sulfur oxidation DsrE/DsrF family protein